MASNAFSRGWDAGKDGEHFSDNPFPRFHTLKPIKFSYEYWLENDAGRQWLDGMFRFHEYNKTVIKLRFKNMKRKKNEN